ncbi:hypothetical protein FB45DRAFT_955176 [Roridomyces roridus]|uniref:Uncharacterized protein n=1 Tax=Roridomyces roridus TaxID=1738132 RepID=A0AAD7AYT6_9AGAR|nr:hypothetical protein FB45DRAFT_955176 [Roridomyces roridus]
MHAFRLVLALMGPIFTQIAIYWRSPEEAMALHLRTLDTARHLMPSITLSLQSNRIWTLPADPQLAEPLPAQSPFPAPAPSPAPSLSPAAIPASASSPNDFEAQISELYRLRALIDSGALIPRDSCPSTTDAAAANGPREWWAKLAVVLLLLCFLCLVILAYAKNAEGEGDKKAGVSFLARLTAVFRGHQTTKKHHTCPPRAAALERPLPLAATDNDLSSADPIVLADRAFCGLADGWPALTIDERVSALRHLMEHVRPSIQHNFLLDGQFRPPTTASGAQISLIQLRSVWDLLCDDDQTAVVDFFTNGHVPQELTKSKRAPRAVLDNADWVALKRYLDGLVGGWQSLPRMRRVRIVDRLRQLSLVSARNLLNVDGTFYRPMASSPVVLDREAAVCAAAAANRLEGMWGSLCEEQQVEIVRFLHQHAHETGARLSELGPVAGGSAV